MFRQLFCKHDFKVMVDSLFVHVCRWNNIPIKHSVNIICVKCHKKKKIITESLTELEVKIEGMDNL